MLNWYGRLAQAAQRAWEGSSNATAPVCRQWRCAFSATAQRRRTPCRMLCSSRYRRLDALRDPSAAGAWLRSIVRNTCRMRLRAAPPDYTDKQAVLDLWPSGEPSPHELIERNALRDLVSLVNVMSSALPTWRTFFTRGFPMPRWSSCRRADISATWRKPRHLREP